MKFGEKLKQLRTEHGMTQGALAEKLGVSLRTLQNYETCKIYPKQSDIYGRIASLFGVSADYLLQDDAPPAHDQVDTLVAQMGSLFAGGSISEDDKDKVLFAITELYWKAKEKNGSK